MVVCEWCFRDMRSAPSCSVSTLSDGSGRLTPMMPYGAEPDWRGRQRGRCGDCGVDLGGWHHPGCDLQACPVCWGQLLSCGCTEMADDVDEPFVEPLGFDGNGCFTELWRTDDVDVVVHYDDVPESDVTVVDGIRCTTLIRTLIDLAPECEPDEIAAMIDDALGRGTLRLDEAWARVTAADMIDRPGARIIRALLPEPER